MILTTGCDNMVSIRRWW